MNFLKFITSIFVVFLFTVSVFSCKKTTKDLDIDSPECKNCYYVATTGNDSNSGSITSPFQTLGKALTQVIPGDTIFLRGGTYYKELNSTKAVLIINISGTSKQWITICAYHGEKPVFDFSTVTPSDRQYGLIIENSKYITIKKLEFKNLRMSGSSGNSYGVCSINSSYITFDQIVSHDHQGVGIQVRGNSTFNIVKNCDSYNNYDILAGGQDADGIQLCYINDTCINYVQGCRMWNNSDDGLDLWENNGIVYVTGNWAWHNGFDKGGTTATGNGEGFKLGKTTSVYTGKTRRYVYNNLAFYNKQSGLVQSEGECPMFIYNNTAYQNYMSGFGFPGTKSVGIIFRNNLSCSNNGYKYISSNHTQEYNSWNLSHVPANSDFASVDSTGVTGVRNQNGSLPGLNFLKLAASSYYINTGIDVGLNFLGKAPDLGAYEKQ